MQANFFCYIGMYNINVILMDGQCRNNCLSFAVIFLLYFTVIAAISYVHI